jgi:hypothetical protein
MSVTPEFQAELDNLARKPLPQQLEYLVRSVGVGTGTGTGWASSTPLRDAYLSKLAIEQTALLAKVTSDLTKWLIALTWVLVGIGVAGLVTAWWYWAHPR